MKIDIRKQIDYPEKTLKEFTLLAIYVPPGTTPPTENILEQPELARYYQNWGRKNDHALFALSKGQVIGACWSRCFLDDAPGYGTIAANIPELSIAIKPEFRGISVGTKLLEGLLSILRTKYSAVSLSVDISNPAMRLYQRFGFENYEQKDKSILMIMYFPNNLNDI
jgi:ribosomal protein S18 acetylase RimI-like enzyme